MAKIEGGCLCGHIRYTCEAEPLMSIICHCKNCQRQGGAAYSTNVAVPKGTLNISGEMALYPDKGDSGNTVNRYFCQKCGSPIISEPAAIDTISILKAGTLDDSSWLVPSIEIFCDSAQDWTKAKVELESHSKMMPS